MNFNENLYNLRRAKGLSQEQLASQINVSRQAISKWETAESQPDLVKLILISNIFEVSLDELCGKKTETETESKTTQVLPDATTNHRIRTVWLCVIVLIIGLMIGLIGGIFAAGVFFPGNAQQKIEKITITSFYIIPELYNQKMGLVFSPSISKNTYNFKVLKTDSTGKTSSFPAVYREGVCTCEVAIDNLQSDFTLNAVISDGTYEYKAGLVKIYDLVESGYSSEDLWNK